MELWLYDSATQELLQADDLGITQFEYDAACMHSVQADTAEGHIMVNGRRVFAAE